MLRFTIMLVTLLVSIVVADAETETFPGPDGKPLNRTKCRISPKGCFDEAHDTCHGPYHIITGENHTGGILADLWAGPVIWYSFTYVCGERPKPPSSAPIISGTGSPPSVSQGTGIAVSSQGHILTNAHVVAGCSTAMVRGPDGTTETASIVARSEPDDLAVLMSKPVTQRTADFRVTPTVRVGESIVVFGFPLPGLLSSAGNATIGNVTSLAGLFNNSSHYQISAPVQPGNSGGPLLDTKGNVIGIVFSKLNALKVAKVTDDIPQNINFAIKASVAENFMDVAGVTYASSTASEELSTPDVVERAKAFTVGIRCMARANAVSAGAPNSPGQPNPGQQSNAPGGNPSSAIPTAPNMEGSASLFVDTMSDALGGEPDRALGIFNSLYGDRVNYFHKDFSKAQVLADLGKELSRWPQRSYKLKTPPSVECNEAELQCRVRGQWQFDARSSPRNRHSFGTAEFDYLLQFGPDRLKFAIIAEDGKLIERKLESLGGGSG